MIMASNPANFSSAGQKPPPWESPIQPVRGDLATAVMRLCPEMGVAGHHAEAEGQDVVRPQGIGVGGHVPQQIVQAQGAAAQIFAVKGLAGFLDSHLSAAQIHMQNLTVVSVWHGLGLLFWMLIEWMRG